MKSDSDKSKPVTKLEAQGTLAATAGSASEVDVIRREHAAIAASYEAQRDTINGSGLPYGPCQCSVCAGEKTPNEQTECANAGCVQRVVRRRLIVDFFNLGPLSRWDVCDKGRWLTESDLQLHKEAPDQELWALAFERAEQRGELDMMRKYVNAETPNV